MSARTDWKLPRSCASGLLGGRCSWREFSLRSEEPYVESPEPSPINQEGPLHDGHGRRKRIGGAVQARQESGGDRSLLLAVYRERRTRCHAGHGSDPKENAGRQREKSMVDRQSSDPRRHIRRILFQDVQKGRSARPQRAKQAEVEVKVELKSYSCNLSLGLSLNLSESWQTFSTS